ncbi:MAG: trypsin-like peptidase domain-containing protein [Pirellulaceae bacterium]|nr:trypsin-like peptidase domain-containing protein [Pirellulaceae bacterium]
MIRRAIIALALLNAGVLIGWLFHSQTQPIGVFGQLAPSPASVSPFAAVVPNSAANPTSPVAWPEQSPEEIININVYELCNRGVVNISTKLIRQTSFFTESAVEGSGSGAIIDRLGHIATNFHVIDGAREINVTLFTGDSYPAILVGHDADNDIAVLRISAPEESLFPIAFGDSSSLRVGQHIIAIGNPFGYDRTMSTGIISSLNRLITSKTRRKMKSIIQIDAALNQGNSGGPLLNSRGQLIGINTAIATSTGDNAGIGFAIPSNTIARVVPQLIQNGKVSRPTIGIIEAFESRQGLLIRRTTPGGPAEKAGLQGVKVTPRRIQRGPLVFEQYSIDQSSADLIIGVDGSPVKTADDFLNVIESKKAGDVVRVTVIRQGRQVDVPVTLGADE